MVSNLVPSVINDGIKDFYSALAPVASKVVVVTAVAATVGFIAGRYSGSSEESHARRKRSRRKANLSTGRVDPAVTDSTICPPIRTKGAGRNVDICECGVRLSDLMPEDRAAHMNSARHRRNIIQIQKRAQEIIVCEEIGEYRAAAVKFVGPDDYVLEVGSHVGATTKVIAGRTKHIVGLDQQADLVAEARINLPDIQFEIGDAFDAHRVLALANAQPRKKFEKVFVDISGSRDLSTVIRLVDMYENTLKPDIMVVKSQRLKHLLLRAQLWVQHPERDQNDVEAV